MCGSCGIAGRDPRGAAAHLLGVRGDEPEARRRYTRGVGARAGLVPQPAGRDPRASGRYARAPRGGPFCGSYVISFTAWRGHADLGDRGEDARAALLGMRPRFEHTGTRRRSRARSPPGAPRSATDVGAPVQSRFAEGVGEQRNRGRSALLGPADEESLVLARAECAREAIAESRRAGPLLTRP